MKNRDSLVLVTALLLGAVTAPASAQAKELRPPAQIDAMPARMVIGVVISGEDRANFVAWQTGLTGPGECFFERISDENSLPEDVSIHGTKGDNHVLLIPRALSRIEPAFWFCGQQWLWASLGSSKEHALTVYGEAGNDVVVAGVQSPPPVSTDPWLAFYGGEGNDTIVAQQARDIFGEGGDDFLLAWFNPTGKLDGAAGKDKLCWGNDIGIPPDGPGGIHGGADFDNCFGSSPTFVGCENHAAFYPTSNPAWFKQECLTPAKAAQALVWALKEVPQP